MAQAATKEKTITVQVLETQTAADYTPQFRDDVTISYQGYNPASGQFETVTLPVRAAYCLTNDSAKQLAALFPMFNCEITLRWPLGYSLVPGYQASDSVPHMVFSDSVGRSTDSINAGLLASYWDHGYPASFAYSSALQDVLSRFGW